MRMGEHCVRRGGSGDRRGVGRVEDGGRERGRRA